MHHDDDDGAAMVRLPVPFTQRKVEPMAVDQTGNDQVILPPSEFESLGNGIHASAPAFDINNVFI